MRTVGDVRAPSRLSSVTGWRTAALDALAAADVDGVPIEPRLWVTLPPWT